MWTYFFPKTQIPFKLSSRQQYYCYQLTEHSKRNSLSSQPVYACDCQERCFGRFVITPQVLGRLITYSSTDGTCTGFLRAERRLASFHAMHAIVIRIVRIFSVKPPHCLLATLLLRLNGALNTRCMLKLLYVEGKKKKDA